LNFRSPRSVKVVVAGRRGILKFRDQVVLAALKGRDFGGECRYAVRRVVVNGGFLD
jgi:hypothetical protein